MPLDDVREARASGPEEALQGAAPRDFRAFFFSSILACALVEVYARLIAFHDTLFCDVVCVLVRALV